MDSMRARRKAPEQCRAGLAAAAIGTNFHFFNQRAGHGLKVRGRGRDDDSLMPMPVRQRCRPARAGLFGANQREQGLALHPDAAIAVAQPDGSTWADTPQHLQPVAIHLHDGDSPRLAVSAGCQFVAYLVFQMLNHRALPFDSPKEKPHRVPSQSQDGGCDQRAFRFAISLAAVNEERRVKTTQGLHGLREPASDAALCMVPIRPSSATIRPSQLRELDRVTLAP